MGRGPQSAPYLHATLGAECLARLTGAQDLEHRSLLDQQALTHNHRDALATGIRAFFTAAYWYAVAPTLEALQYNVGWSDWIVPTLVYAGDSIPPRYEH